VASLRVRARRDGSVSSVASSRATGGERRKKKGGGKRQSTALSKVGVRRPVHRTRVYGVRGEKGKRKRKREAVERPEVLHL